MELTDAGTLVRISGSGPDADGIVFDAPSRSKIVVAVVDRARGPVFRTVHPETLSARAEAGADDPALTQLIRRTPPPAHGAARGGSGAVRGSSGHARAAMHRTTGK
jgi:hypothetical protein